jgi:hypothetical protein
METGIFCNLLFAVPILNLIEYIYDNEIFSVGKYISMNEWDNIRQNTPFMERFDHLGISWDKLKI